MMKKYLMVEIEEITPELLERFKASGEFVKYQIGDDIYKLAWNSGLSGWVVQHPGRAISIAWHIKDEHLTHYLPDGLPDPSAAVEVFETQIERFYLSGNNDYELGIGYPSEVIPPEGTKVGVFKL
jgi:hypothetical protein